jgi:hypothetical protein
MVADGCRGDLRAPAGEHALRDLDVRCECGTSGDVVHGVAVHGVGRPCGLEEGQAAVGVGLEPRGAVGRQASPVWVLVMSSPDGGWVFR